MPVDRVVNHISEIDLLPGPLGIEFATALASLATSAAGDPGGAGDTSLRAVASVLPVVVYGIDVDGMFRHCYGGGLRALGMQDDELVGEHVSIFGEEAEAKFLEVMEGRVGSYEARGFNDGVEWVYATVTAARPDGSGTISVAIDVTERANAERTAHEQTDMHQQALDALYDSERRFRVIAESAPVGIFLSDADANVEYVNPLVEEITGLSETELLARGWASAIHPDDLEAVFVAHTAFEAGEGPFLEEFRVVRTDASLRWVRARAVHVTGPEAVGVRTVGTIADITDFVLADLRHRESEERTRAILESAAEGIISCDEGSLIVEFNAAAERILGYDSNEVVGSMLVSALVAPHVREELMGFFADYLGGATPRLVGRDAIEVDLQRKDGSFVEVEMALTEVSTSAGRLFTAMIQDISERKRVERELEHHSTHDVLTGLPNRALLVAELDAALSRAARQRRGVGVLFVELDRIKPVTDSLGHSAGDQILVETARRLRGAMVDQGVVARFGGEQFVVAIEDLDDVTDAVALAAFITDEVARAYDLAGDEAFISSNTGIAFAAAGSGTAEGLIANADVAMYRAKASSTMSYEVFDTDMRSWVDERRKLENGIRHGLERGEFELYYQPVISVASRRVQGFEALVRWNHPDLGLVPPGRFIPLAEDSGLIVPLGEWILREACRQLSTWQRDVSPDLRMSVNLSGHQLALADLAVTVSSALDDAGAKAAGLDLEITETVILEDVETVAHTLRDLKEIGVNLAMDDFGTGYSSLTYLCQLPIDIVKVDRSFVSQIGTHTRDASIVSLVVGLAQTLQLDVVAEGVETDEQLAALVDLDCGYAQGFLFSKAVPAQAATALLNGGRGWAVP